MPAIMYTLSGKGQGSVRRFIRPAEDKVRRIRMNNHSAIGQADGVPLLNPAIRTGPTSVECPPSSDRRLPRRGETTTRDSTELRTVRARSMAHKAPWALETTVWSVIAFMIPINHSMPSVVRALYFTAIGAMICIPVLFKRATRPIYPAVWAFAGYASFISILLAPNISTIVDNLFVGAQLILLLGVGVFALTYNSLTDPNFASRLGIAFLIGQSLSASVALAQQMGHSILVPATLAHGRSLGLAEHQNTLGLMACIGILLALQILLVGRKFRPFTLAALAVNVLALIASGSLTAVMGLLVGLIVLVICMRGYLAKTLVWGTALAPAAWLVASAIGLLDRLPSLSERYRQVTGQAKGGSSWEVRRQTYDFAWSKIAEDPLFGRGLNIQSSGTFNGITQVHNALIRAWYQGGILLGVAFALITIAIAIVVFQALIAKEHGIEASILVAVLVFMSLSVVLEQREFWLPILVAWSSISATTITKNMSINQVGSPRLLVPSRRSKGEEPLGIHG